VIAQDQFFEQKEDVIMGYYTNYTLIVTIEDESKYTKKDIIAHLRRENEEALRALDENGNAANEAKWYKSDEDMIEFSKKYPNVIFILNQVGQDGDEFDNSFQNGAMN
jgi:hypothetical protein